MREQGLTVRAVVREGHAAAEILDEVSEGHYDLVMLGDAQLFLSVETARGQHGDRDYAECPHVHHGDTPRAYANRRTTPLSGEPTMINAGSQSPD